MGERVDESELLERIARLAEAQDRVLVAIAGPPGAGKSTLAESLRSRIPGAAVLPMDGFHLDNEVLAERGLIERKGAAETFDAAGFAKLVSRVRDGEAVDVPTFDRERDRVVPGGDRIGAEIRVVLVEGNYLLLASPGWSELAVNWDISVFLEVPQDELMRRLVARWRDHGLDPEAAAARAEGNDLRNARSIESESRLDEALRMRSV